MYWWLGNSHMCEKPPFKMMPVIKEPDSIGVYSEPVLAFMGLLHEALLPMFTNRHLKCLIENFSRFVYHHPTSVK